MVRKKKIRTRGKLQLSRYFQDLKKGDTVTVISEYSLQPQFPKRIQGKTGLIEGKRGRGYIVAIKDRSKQKTYLIKPIHLKKIKQT